MILSTFWPVILVQGDKGDLSSFHSKCKDYWGLSWKNTGASVKPDYQVEIISFCAGWNKNKSYGFYEATKLSATRSKWCVGDKETVVSAVLAEF